MCLIFVGKGRRRKYLTTKISQSTVSVVYMCNNTPQDTLQQTRNLQLGIPSAHARGLQQSLLCVCVCVCVCHHASYYIPCLYVKNKVPLNFLCHFLHVTVLCRFHQKCFVEKFWQHLLTTSAFFAARQTLKDKRDSDGFVST